MKYWTQLNELDAATIDIDMVNSSLNVLINGFDNSNPSDVLNSLYLIQETLDQSRKKISDNFQALWDMLREDETESTKNNYDFDSLNNVVKNWVEP